MIKPKVKIRGIIACPGNIRGKVWKIEDPIQVPRVRKKAIIVTTFTTPILAPAISEALAIVCETGGLTSHSAIIAREFGIPCLVGAKGVLAAFVDGQTVEIKDGTIYAVK
ncbi:MAG TPA: PEP-utilizing enzyme [Patescibacteria group bacterium]|nr:PEP-utilizing enzyme [Patescibacteria group bacterium]